MNLKYKWSVEQIEYMMQEYEKTSVKECANYLKFPESVITNKARKLGLKIRKNGKHIWTKHEDQILIDNYPIKGLLYCSNELGLTADQIHNRVSILKLKQSDELSISKLNIDVNKFTKNISKEIAYILGYWWADGYVDKIGSKSFRIRLTCAEDDINSIRPLLESIGKWSYCLIDRTAKNNKWKKYIEVSTNNKRLHSFLLENDYDKKSECSANKILSNIPDYLHCYFFRGLIDGDGYWCKTIKNNCFGIASTYNQNWQFVESVLNKLDIKYSISRRIHKIGKSSSILVYKIEDIVKLRNFIYPNGYDGVGLYRKYENAIRFLKS